MITPGGTRLKKVELSQRLPLHYRPRPLLTLRFMATSSQLPASSAIYQTLASPSQTRLVTFHDTRDDGDFEAQLDVVDLDKPRVTFQALSYLCGDPTPRSRVHLAGTCTHVALAQNLTDAIRRLLRDGHRGPIWIDAISIKQDDIAERNVQVRLMTRIYRGAREVIGWLGLELPDCRRTIDIVSQWAQPVLRRPNDFSGLRRTQ